MSRNEFLSEIFENLDADYEMLMGSGKYEHSCRPITAIFRCVISVYFSSFFIDHPVEVTCSQKEDGKESLQKIILSILLSSAGTVCPYEFLPVFAVGETG